MGMGTVYTGYVVIIPALHMFVHFKLIFSLTPGAKTDDFQCTTYCFVFGIVSVGIISVDIVSVLRERLGSHSVSSEGVCSQETKQWRFSLSSHKTRFQDKLSSLPKVTPPEVPQRH
jgi:hypothetical protein